MTTNIKIKVNQSLFNRWKQLGFRMNMLGSIVQNDMTISQEQYQENKDLWAECQKEFDDLKTCTQLWVEYQEEVAGQHKLQLISLRKNNDK